MMNRSGILAVGLNPAMQKTLVLDHLWENEVNRTAISRFDVSGKGMNVARILAQSTARVIYLSHAGGLFRERFMQMAREEGVDARLVDSRSEIRICSTLIDRERKAVTEIVEESERVSPETENQVKSRYLTALGEVDTVTISGTKAPGYSDDIIPWMVFEARERNLHVVLDIQGADLRGCLPHRPTIIKPNLKEFAQTLFPNTLFPEHADPNTKQLEMITEKMRELWHDHGIVTILTRGERPLRICLDGEVEEIAVDRVEPVNPIGSGDAFTAALALGLHHNLPLRHSITLAQKFGQANARELKPGTITGSSIHKKILTSGILQDSEKFIKFFEES